MARSTAEETQRTRERVLQEAHAQFAARGYAGASLEEIARCASVTRGAVYHHFTNKSGLFQAVMVALQAQVAADVRQAAENTGPDAKARLRAGCHAFVDAITEPSRLRILLVEAPSAVGWRAWREADAANSEVLLREGLRECGVDAALIDVYAVQLSGAMNEAALWIADQGNSAESRTKAHRVLDAVLDSVQLASSGKG